MREGLGKIERGERKDGGKGERGSRPEYPILVPCSEELLTGPLLIPYPSTCVHRTERERGASTLSLASSSLRCSLTRQLTFVRRGT